jgi:hypothetical protein
VAGKVDQCPRPLPGSLTEVAQDGEQAGLGRLGIAHHAHAVLGNAHGTRDRARARHVVLDAAQGRDRGIGIAADADDQCGTRPAGLRQRRRPGREQHQHQKHDEHACGREAATQGGARPDQGHGTKRSHAGGEGHGAKKNSPIAWS